MYYLYFVCECVYKLIIREFVINNCLYKKKIKFFVGNKINNV